MTDFVFLNGQFAPSTEAKISVFDHGFLYGDGIYETLRTIDGKVFDICNHYERLQNSAKLLKLTIPYTLPEITKFTEELLLQNGFSTEKPARIRWTLTRGNNHFYFSDSKSPTFLIATSQLPPYPDEYLQNGVSTTTIDTQRILAEAKTTSLLPMILGKQKAEGENCFECLFLEDGFITEGTVSNFFILDQNKSTIYTAPENKILPGTAAKIFRKKAQFAEINIQEKLFSPQETLEVASEAFLTNSLFGIMPVTTLAGQKIGDGRVGELFQKIHKNFWNL